MSSIEISCDFCGTVKNESLYIRGIAEWCLVSPAVHSYLDQQSSTTWRKKIQKLTPVKAWRYGPGSLNPADCPSRGCSAKQLCSSKCWEGPSWLHLLPQEWPISDAEVDVNEVQVNKERRDIVTSMNVQTTDIKRLFFHL
ncbi:integrase_H2C2 domain-containing protein [Trichonephila clavipes]|nr:integrase_H2C2 domain-containing protein [Trichonephila clavipes]